MANKPGLHGRDHRPGGADPIPADNQTGWTVVFGDGDATVDTFTRAAIWKVDRNIVGDGTYNWYIYDPSASVSTKSTVLDVEIAIYRVRGEGGGFTTTSSLLDDNIVIDAGTLDSRESASPAAVTQFKNLLDQDVDPYYDSIMIQVEEIGDATGLSVNIPIGIERVPGSGVH